MYVRSRRLVGVFTSESFILRFRLPSSNVIEDAKSEIISSNTNKLGWAGRIMIMEEQRIPKKGLKRKLPYCETSGKTKN